MHCDSCQGGIGGPRLFCLDCAIKSAEYYDSLDLCCAPQCVGSRVTDRENLERAHEPNHRLVKVRTPVLLRNQGRAHRNACEAFERVRIFCTKIAEFCSHPREGLGHHGQKTPSAEPTSTDSLAEDDKLEDVHTAPDRTDNRAESEVKESAEVKTAPAPDAVQGQAQGPEQDLPTCGKCKGSLSFPFWYCIVCEGRSRVRTLFLMLTTRSTQLDNLFICDACDTEGVPDLVRGSGRHMEDHHLIRCLAPENVEDKALPTEQRLTMIEGSLGGMQTQLGDLSAGMGDVTSRIGDLNGRVDDLTTRMGDLNGYVGDVTSRIGNIEQLLHRLIGTLGNTA